MLDVPLRRILPHSLYGGYEGHADEVDCHEEHEEHSSIFLAALRHTLEIFVFILLFSFIIGLIFGCWRGRHHAAFLGGMGIFQPMLTALVGLVPNCAASVLLAQLYMEGAITFGSLFAGLTAGAGVGLAVLWRVNPSWKQNLFMTGLLWAVGAATGMVLQLRFYKKAIPHNRAARPHRGTVRLFSIQSENHTIFKQEDSLCSTVLKTTFCV